MFPERLKELRSARGLSTTALAEAVYVSQPYIVRLEKDIKKPSAELLARFADYFGVTTDYLLGRD